MDEPRFKRYLLQTRFVYPRFSEPTLGKMSLIYVILLRIYLLILLTVKKIFLWNYIIN